MSQRTLIRNPQNSIRWLLVGGGWWLVVGVVGGVGVVGVVGGDGVGVRAHRLDLFLRGLEGDSVVEGVPTRALSRADSGRLVEGVVNPSAVAFSKCIIPIALNQQIIEMILMRALKICKRILSV